MHHRLPLRAAALLPAAFIFLTAAPKSIPPGRPVPTLSAWFEPARTGDAWLSRGSAGTLVVDRHGAWLQLRGSDMDALVRLSLLNAGAGKQPLGETRLPGISAAIHGSDPAKWRGDIPHYARVRVGSVYPGIDVLYYAMGGVLEYDFELAPGSDPAAIAFRLDGSSSARLSPEGDLLVTAGPADIRQLKPVAYQMRDGHRHPVAASYHVDDNGKITFELGDYDRSLPLTIDPVLSFRGYFGGYLVEKISAVAAAPDGSFWIAGSSGSELAAAPGSEPYQAAKKGLADAFLAKVRGTAEGTYTVEHFTYIGGSQDDEITALTVDANGIVYAAGWTDSTDWPIAGNTFQIAPVGGREATVLRYDISQTEGPQFNLSYSSYYGAEGADTSFAISVDSKGIITVAGSTSSGTPPKAPSQTSLQPSGRGGIDAFVFQVDPSQTPAANTLKQSTFFGGNGSDVARGVGTDPQGRIVIIGTTTSDDLPTAGTPYQANTRGRGDTFLALIDPSRDGLDQLIYGTYFGGSDLDWATSMAMDANGRCYITGYTLSPDFPYTPDAYINGRIGSADAVVYILDSQKQGPQTLVYATAFGGVNTDVAYGIALLPGNKVAISGYTTSRDLPEFGITGLDYQRFEPGLTEMFVATIDPSIPGTGALLSSSPYGGGTSDVSTSVAANAGGEIIVGGYTNSYGLTTSADPVGKPNGIGLITGYFFALKP